MLDLRIRRPMKLVSLQKLDAVTSFAGAISECAAMSGLQDKSIAIETGVDAGLWSRIKSGDAGIKGELLDRLMDACGNELPLLYLLHKRGYDITTLRPLESQLQRELTDERRRRAEVEAELATIKKFVRETKGAA